MSGHPRPTSTVRRLGAGRLQVAIDFPRSAEPTLVQVRRPTWRRRLVEFLRRLAGRLSP